jgi:hypothetical protein
MKFPDTNKIHREPIPDMVESNIKLLEEKLKAVDWSVFRKTYLMILSYALLTLFGVILTVGVAKYVVSLLYSL